MKYKVGDMVIMDGECDGNYFHCAIGKIAGIYNGWGVRTYSVDFTKDLEEHPEHFDNLNLYHDCNGFVPTKKGWKITEEMLSPYVLKSERTLTLYRKKLRTE